MQRGYWVSWNQMARHTNQSRQSVEKTKVKSRRNRPKGENSLWWIGLFPWLPELFL
jgi:hypothetical protein